MSRISMADAMRGADIRGKARKIANNTFRYCRASDGADCIRLHRTDIAARTPDGRVELNSNGWETVTTKARINDALSGTGACLCQIKREWFVYDIRNGWEGAPRVPYRDGLVVPDCFDRKGN